MANDWFDQALQTIQQPKVAKTAPSPRSSGDWFDRALSSVTASPVSASPKKEGYLQGGPIAKVFDILRTGEYAVGGVLSGKGVRRGIAERTESYPLFLEKFTGAGNSPSFAHKAAAFAASLVIDPINLVGIGLPGKVLRSVGAAGAAAKYEGAAAKAGAAVGRAAFRAVENIAPEAAKAMKGRQALDPILEAARKAEYGGTQRALDLAQAVRKDAHRLAPTKKVARTYDEALGGFFDAGADATLNALSQGATPEAARVIAAQAQQAWLQSLPAPVRNFVEKWAPDIARQEDEFAQELVRVRLMRPETAEKWRGIHLRRIYQKFENIHEYVEFLSRHDPFEAAQLLSKAERGVPISRAGKPLPHQVKAAREALEATTRAHLGEITQASSRIAAGEVLASKAVARGRMYAEVANKFGIDETIVKAHPLAHKLYRQMPDSPGWGALAGKWLPKEIAQPLLEAVAKPTGIDKFLTTLTGWWKFAKVIANPATHARNIRTNISLAHNAIGLGALNPKTWTEAVREVLTNGPMFREAKMVNAAFMDTFTHAEIQRFIGGLEGKNPLLKALGAGKYTMERAYEVEEQVGKMAVYLSLRKKGLTADAAGLLAEQALFDYGKVPKVVQTLRSKGAYPFITFPYKVATETLPLVLKRPGRLSQQVKLLRRATRDEIPEDEKRALPAYMRSGGYVPLPIKDSKGRPLYYDLTYELFFGDLGETGTPVAAVVELFRGNRDYAYILPLLTPFGQAVAEVALNKSAFTGTEIRRRGETLARGATRHLARFALPTWAFNVGETAAANLGVEPEPQSALARAVMGTKTRLGGEPPDIGPALAQTFAGLRTVPLDVKERERSSLLSLAAARKELISEIASIARNPNLTEEQQQRLRARAIADYQAKLKRFQDEGIMEP